jgi:hypothetical protein
VALRIEASGPLNPARLFGQPSADRAGYKNIEVIFHLESDADERATLTHLLAKLADASHQPWVSHRY